MYITAVEHPCATIIDYSVCTPRAHVSPCAASFTALTRTALEAPCSSASFAPATLIILMKMKYTMCHGFGCVGCIREKSAS